MARVFLGVGSNEGDRLNNISDAIRRLSILPDIRIKQIAPVIETRPVGGPPQGPYLNTVVEMETALAAEKLLGLLQDTERQLGRVPGGPRWGPRPIDLDILFYDDRIINTQALQVPHPRLHERRFVLEPLTQIEPALIHPVLKRSVKDLLAQLSKPSTSPDA